MIVAALVASLIATVPELFKGLGRLIELFWYKVALWIDSFNKRGVPNIKAYASAHRTTDGCKFTISKQYRAVIYKLRKCKQLLCGMENPNSYDIYGWRDQNIKNLPQDIVIARNCSFYLKDDKINITSTVATTNQSTERTFCKVSDYVLDISGCGMNSDDLLETINVWVEEYEEFTKRYTAKKITYNINHPNELNTKKDTENDDNRDGNSKNKEDNINWSSHPFTSTKSFDTVFFKDKRKMINKLDKFINDPDFYVRTGQPYMLGILIHGEPGCGKSSIIKSIAKYTQRHIMYVNLNDVKNDRELENIFYGEFVNGNYIPYDKRIIILEDIDCAGTVAHERKSGSEDEEVKEILKDASTSVSDKIYLKKVLEEQNKNSDKLTLACLLNLIDGVMEQHGRILIITTNHIEKLDPALIRDGRISIRIELCRCTDEMLYDGMKLFFPKDKDKIKNFVVKHHKDISIKPSTLQNICTSSEENSEDIDTLFKTLLSDYKVEVN
jgi:ABC-type dipeptide/oligopeptide/nickel transport system ATPase component